tara:strand:- start:111 stop:383 length:273 start_codon:yes stop_codon:yes gene_type:complete
MEVIVEITSVDGEVLEVHARKCLKARGKKRLLDKKTVGGKKIKIIEFTVGLDDYTDQDIKDWHEGHEPQEFYCSNEPRKWKNFKKGEYGK